jgi:ABC-2 type transport system ATP-binding protein
MTNAIETRGLGKRFRRRWAVRDLTLAVPEGAVFAFLGPNGAGKTTTIKTFMNLLRPSAGSAAVLGVPSRRLGPATLAQIGYVSENQALPDWMTVAQLLAFCRPLYPSWDDGFATRLVAQFELPLGMRLRDMSRGMRVKASLLSSLAYRPRLLVLDEPFTGLDVLVRDDLIRGILELSEQERWTVFVSSHDIDEVERLADWVGVLNDGHLELAEPVAALQARFRRMEMTVAGDGGTPTPPASWLVVERAAHRVSLVDSRYDATATPAALERVFGPVRDVLVSPMSLRDIFLALAQTYRLAAHREVA